MHKIVLALDGGGAKGLLPLTVLDAITDTTKAEPVQEFDLVIGSSVGAITGGILSTGILPVKTFKDIFYKDLPKIFAKRVRAPIFQPKYSREPVQNLLDAYIKGVQMKQCKTKFISTSVSLVDGRTHFFKSWEEKDGELNLTQTILRSAAAPLYFGTMVDKETKNVWMDGGCGDMNAPIMQAFIEVMRQGWLLEEHVHILSLGCGQANQGMPFKEAMSFNNIRQLLFFMNPVEGGLSRAQLSMTQEQWLTALSKYRIDLTFQRVEMYDMPKEIDKMDGVKYRDEYVKIGEELAKQVDYTYL